MASVFFPQYFFYDAVGMADSKVKPVYHQRVIDFAVQNLAVGDAAAMIAVPDNSLVLHCNYQTLVTITDATGSFAVASETKGITYVTAAVAVAAGLFGVPAAISASTAQAWYAAKDSIRIKTVTVATLAVGQARVFAVMLYPQPYSYVNVAGTTKTYTFVDHNDWSTTAPTF